MPEAADRGRFVEGFSAAVLGNLVGLLVAGAMSPVIGGSALEGIGIVQLLWLIPVWRSYRKQGKT
jgi:predicted lipid-binding transport protein (Tim44 family)